MKKYFLILLSLALIISSCEVRQSIIASGDMIKESRTVDDFSGISVSDGIDLYLTMTDENSVEVESNDNIIPHIDTYLSGTTLIVEINDAVNIVGAAKIKVFVNAKDISFLSLSGGSFASIENDITADRLDIELSGGSNLSASVWCNNLVVNLSGASEITVDGGTENYDLTSSGGSTALGYDMITNQLSCDISGGGTLKLTVNESLEVTASGGSIIHYKGSGDISKKELSGGSELINVN